MTVTYSVQMNLLTTLPIVVTTKPFSRHKNSVPQTFLVMLYLKTNLLHGLKPLLLLLHITLHCLMTRTLFTNIPIVAYRRSNNLSHILVRALNCQGLIIVTMPGPPGFFWCYNRNYTTCPYIDHGRDNYTFYSTGKTYKIKPHITCYSGASARASVVLHTSTPKKIW